VKKIAYALIPLAAVIAVVFLTGCDERGATTTSVAPAQKIGSNGRFDIYHQCFEEQGDHYKTCLYVVPNATVTYTCGKSCIRTVSSPVDLSTPAAQAALDKIPASDRMLLGLPVGPGPRDAALAKLSPDERKALGL
jgi:hypothetical protein